MQKKVVRKELEIGGKKLILETGELASHANAAVLVTYGETVVLATAVSQNPSQDLGYFPLSVDLDEKLYAGGRISTSRFIKRENRPSEKAILTSRLIDRSIRPLFPKDYQAEVQIIITVLSIDNTNDPDIPSLIATSAALAISDIPWDGPISGLRVGLKDDGSYIINPTEEERSTSPLDVIFASTQDEAVMIETQAKEVDEKTVSGAFKFALDSGKTILKLIDDFVKEAGQTKQEYKVEKLEPQTESKVRQFIEKNIMADFDTKSQDEGWFNDSLKLLDEEFIDKEENKELKEAKKEDLSSKILANILEDVVTDKLRDDILIHNKRPDGRKTDEIRQLTIKAGLLPRTHGSAIFQRGETQVLSIVTLGSPALEQLIEGMYGEETKRYMHHYNFPPFSSGEVKRRGAPGRREIGHGALAEKALTPVIPTTDQFPYTIRVVSEVLSSAGSTSQASVCASTLALMDAGVPIKEPVAGISIGLITDKKDRSKYVTITDIAYQEDAQGDMDFKVAGTKNGITAIQMDIKLNGLTMKILEESLEKARTARLYLLGEMLKTIPETRKQLSKHAPRVIVVKIDPSKIGEVVGSGGRVINKIIAETGAAIDITDDGNVTISSKDAQACQKAADWVEGIVKEPQPNEEYEGMVKRIMNFGAFVEILPGKEGLVHISQLAPERVENVEDVVKIGQKVKVRVVEVDDQGRLNLSMLFGDDIKEKTDREPRRDFPRGRFDNNRGGRDRGPRRGPKRF
jgi:polyribonucleotide nucleotidyltransferase